jgi:hypothetical protein
MGDMGDNRRLFLQDGSQNEPRNFVFESLLQSFRSRFYEGLPNQLLIVDACASYLEDMHWPVQAQGEKIPHHPERSLNVVRQYVLYATSAGEAAANNEVVRSGAFSRVVLDALEESSEFIGDIDALHARASGYFAGREKSGEALQRPAFYVYRVDDKELAFGRITVQKPWNVEQQRNSYFTGRERSWANCASSSWAREESR